MVHFSVFGPFPAVEIITLLVKTQLHSKCVCVFLVCVAVASPHLVQPHGRLWKLSASI